MKRSDLNWYKWNLAPNNLSLQREYRKRSGLSAKDAKRLVKDLKKCNVDIDHDKVTWIQSWLGEA